MTISISEKEYNAIVYATNQIESLIESALDEDYIKESQNVTSSLYNIQKKYKKAKFRDSYYMKVKNKYAP